MKQRIFSGVQPSGDLHIGNYLGAIKNWVSLQDTHENIFCIVDLHAITLPQDPKELKKRIREVANIYLAAGIDSKKSAIFIQSDRPEHSELAWILNCFTYMGELRRMTQFKEKSQIKDDQEAFKLVEKIAGEEVKKREGKKGLDLELFKVLLKTQIPDIIEKTKIKVEENTSVGLFDYPVLMAADILLYNTNLVPVGKDQFQHLEITRTIARRFNNRFGEIFTIPEPYSTPESILIMGLDDPTKKMAKSAKSDFNYIALRDNPGVVRKKIARAVTDSGKEIIYDPAKKPAISNMLNIYSSFSGIPTKELEKKYKDTTYKEFKDDLAQVVLGFLKPFQQKLAELEKDPSYTERVLKEGAEKVAPLARETLKRVKKAAGLGL